MISALIAQQPRKNGAGQIQAEVDYLVSHPVKRPVRASSRLTPVAQVFMTKDDVDSPANKLVQYQGTVCK